MKIRIEREPERVEPVEWPAFGYRRDNDGSIVGKKFIFDSPNYTLPEGYYALISDVPKRRGRPRKPREPGAPAEPEHQEPEHQEPDLEEPEGETEPV